MRRKIIKVGLSAVVAMLLISPILMTQGRPRVGVIIYKYDDTFMSGMRRNIETFLKGKATLSMNDGQNSQARVNDIVDTLIARRNVAIAVNLVDLQAADAVIAKAKAKDIPVVFFNRQPSDAAMSSYEKAWYVGADARQSGVMQGEILANAWKANAAWDKSKDRRMQYVLLKGEPGHQDAEQRTEAVVSTLRAAGLNVQQLELQTGMWNTSTAKDIMDAWLQKHGDKIEAIIANNDDMAIGALNSVKAAGYNQPGGAKYIPIVGIDAHAVAQNYVKSGELLGTVLNDAEGQAKAVSEILLNVANGRDPLAGTSYTFDTTQGVKFVNVPYKPIIK